MKEEKQMCTIRERIQHALDTSDWSEDSYDTLIALAYFMGREEAVRILSGKYSKAFELQRRRAEKCRYYKMADAVIGKKIDIAAGLVVEDSNVTQEFGDDLTAL